MVSLESLPSFKIQKRSSLTVTRILRRQVYYLVPPRPITKSLTVSRIVMSVFSSLRYCLGDSTEHGNIWAALGFMPFGLFFDFMDGKIARWRKKSSLMGQELDSLADLVDGHFSQYWYF